MPRHWDRREPRALIILQVAWWLERMSRRFFVPTIKPPTTRFHQVHAARPLLLEQPIYAAHKPPTEYVFIPEDEYFQRVERILEHSA